MEHTKGNWERHNRLYGTMVTEHIWCGDKHIADFDGENATANAKLCVVAPALYDDLQETTDVICDLCRRLNPQHKHCNSCEDQERWRKSLAKAEGK